MTKGKILILGSSGMLGSMLFRRLRLHGYDVVGTNRGAGTAVILGGVDATQMPSVWAAVDKSEATVVVNCIGVIRQRKDGQDPIQCISINSLFPHLLAKGCADRKIRVIHISTDCVFSGKKGSPYLENDFADAMDVYGRSKFLGELNYPNTVTLRTSIIGHEQRGRLSLLEWFLAQSGPIRGFRRAVYSGLPTVELSNVIADYVLPNSEITGLFHVSSMPISKFDLLNVIGRIYDHSIEIIPDDTIQENKSLDSTKFRRATGWMPPSWDQLVKNMRLEYLESTGKSSAQ